MKGTVLLFHLTLSSKTVSIWQQDEDNNLGGFLKIRDWNGPAGASHSLSAIIGKYIHNPFHKQKFMKSYVN